MNNSTNDNTNNDTQSEPRIYYYHTPHIEGVLNRCTIAAKMSDLGQMEFAIARCGDKDHFNRKIGRKIATGRLIAGRLAYSINGFELYVEDCDGVQTFNKELFLNICQRLDQLCFDEKRVENLPLNW